MNQDPYVVFSNAKGNAISAVIAWLGSVLGPAFIVGAWGDYDDWPQFVGLGLALYTLFSIKKGFGELRKGIYSDFVVYSLVPLLLPVAILVWLWVSGG